MQCQEPIATGPVRQSRGSATVVAAALLRMRHSSPALRLAAGAVYGVAAGMLLHDDARVAGAAMVAIWIATVWRPRRVRGTPAR